MCLPYIKFSDPLPETHFFIWPKRTGRVHLTLISPSTDGGGRNLVSFTFTASSEMKKVELSYELGHWILEYHFTYE